MKTKSIFQQICSNSSMIYLGAILLLPFLPFWDYANLGYGFITVMMILLLLVYKKTEIKKGVKMVDLGFVVIAVAVLFSFLKEYLTDDVISLNGSYPNFFIMAGGYFLLRFFSEGELHFKSISKLLMLVFFVTAAFVVYIACRENFNYAMLTSKFNYVEGLGNISQISMYLSFYLIGIFYTQKKHWPLGLVALVGGLLAFILHSKLLLLTIGLLLAGKLLSRYSYKVNAIAFSVLSIGALSFLYWLPPTSLMGRIDLFKMAWTNYDYGNLWGSGLGNFNGFVNTTFENGNAVNTIGEVNHLAFNDFTQVFVELGYPGIIGLLLIFIGLVDKKNLFYVVATGVVLIFMFPLQYLESVMLFAFIAFLLGSNKRSLIPERQLSVIFLKPVAAVSVCLLFCYVGYNMSVLKKWSDADQRMSVKENVHINLRHYKDLEMYLCNDDEYYLRFGIHLLKNKKYNDALKSFKKAQKINPSYKSYIHLGDCYFEMEHYSEALSLYEDALLLRPEHLYPVYKSIYSLSNLKGIKEAQQYWKSRKNNYKLISPKMMTMNKEIEDLLSSRKELF